ncbi:MAG TPA: D-alanyl-D-alanine carboxypeptidase/D-alanyl-D-alanine-endopeptidase, partial [Pyrinomonadaceae bacterium]|nr:D-alanyl-D-alanine carboxypeptidase/D-alanyl-D-alanine-endopeptidase [Pyrinomonadaceae bacterium]
MNSILRKSSLLIGSLCAVTLATQCVSPFASVQAQSPAAASRAIIPAPKAPVTLAELRSRIEEICHQPALDPGFFAVKIVSLDTGQTIFEQDANKFVRPASNMKLYTVATAFDRLTPDYHFVTSVYAKEKADDGKIKGDLIVYGRGDPSIAARFNNGDYFKGINDLADRIVAAGVKRVKGDLVGDESYFNGAPVGSGWEWEDLTWSYGAPVSALSINDNAIDLTIKPAATVGAPVEIVTGPPNASFISIANHATTSPKELARTLRIYRGLGANTLEISGTLPLGDAGFRGGVAIPDPALGFVTMLREALTKRGVKIDGKLRTVTDRSGGSAFPRMPAGFNSPNGTINQFPIEITSLSSPAFATIAAHTLKPSQNQYTELILRTLGRTQPQLSNETRNESDEELGLQIVKNFVKQAGITDNDVALNDGSGLSRNDLISANTTVQLLTYMSKHKYFAQFRDALPIAGVDGTLSTRMRGTPAQGNLRGKTGSLSSVASLSGYVTTAGGEHLVFSMMLNNYPDAGAVRRDSIDA